MNSQLGPFFLLLLLLIPFLFLRLLGFFLLSQTLYTIILFGSASLIVVLLSSSFSFSSCLDRARGWFSLDQTWFSFLLTLLASAFTLVFLVHLTKSIDCNLHSTSSFYFYFSLLLLLLKVVFNYNSWTFLLLLYFTTFYVWSEVFFLSLFLILIVHFIEPRWMKKK